MKQNEKGNNFIKYSIKLQTDKEEKTKKRLIRLLKRSLLGQQFFVPTNKILVPKILFFSFKKFLI